MNQQTESETLDPRLFAARPDLADIRLQGRVEAERFVEGRLARVRDALVPLRNAPGHEAAMDSELLLGETLRIFEVQEGWAWVQSERDGYVGWCAENSLDLHASATTHRVKAMAIHIYPKPDIKVSPIGDATLNAEVAIVERMGKAEESGVAGGAAADKERFAQLEDGNFAVARHLSPRGGKKGDFVAVAQRFLGVPYLWAGRSVHGIDCSGLIQMSMHAAGRGCLRDTDMQEKTLGTRVTNKDPSAWRRGDLVFWPGHVGIVSSPGKILHANAFHMECVEEPLIPTIDRLSRAGLQISAVKRVDQ